jgi:hypothetical protein
MIFFGVDSKLKSEIKLLEVAQRVVLDQLGAAFGDCGQTEKGECEIGAAAAVAVGLPAGHRLVSISRVGRRAAGEPIVLYIMMFGILAEGYRGRKISILGGGGIHVRPGTDRLGYESGRDRLGLAGQVVKGLEAKEGGEAIECLAKVGFTCGEVGVGQADRSAEANHVTHGFARTRLRCAWPAVRNSITDGLACRNIKCGIVAAVPVDAKA